MRLRRPEDTTSYGDMRGSTLLLHLCEATHSIQLRSAVHLLRIADLALSIGSLLPLAGYSSSSPLEDICDINCCPNSVTNLDIAFSPP